MKIYYTCEICGKKHDNEEAALACEKQHEEAALKSKRLAAEQEKRRCEVDQAYKRYCDLVSAYNKDYRVQPIVRFSPMSGFFFE